MQQIVTILGVSGIYALLATGLVLVYKTSRVVSLAQGHIAILFAFFVFVVDRWRISLANRSHRHSRWMFCCSGHYLFCSHAATCR